MIRSVNRFQYWMFVVAALYMSACVLYTDDGAEPAPDAQAISPPPPIADPVPPTVTAACLPRDVRQYECKTACDAPGRVCEGATTAACLTECEAFMWGTAYCPLPPL